MSTKVLLSEADFDVLPRADGAKYELSEGELVMTAAPRAFHNLVRQYLTESLGSFCRAQHLGSVLSETEFRLAPDVIRIPDLAFVRAERISRMNVHERLEGPPDLAVEVVSPNNDASDLALMLQQYLRAGACEVWILYPQTRLAYRYRPGEHVDVRTDGQMLDAPDLFPGWSLAVTDLFNAGTPPPPRVG